MRNDDKCRPEICRRWYDLFCQLGGERWTEKRFDGLWEAILSPAKSPKTEAVKEVSLPSALNQLSESLLAESDLAQDSRVIFTALRDATQGKGEGSASSSKGKGTADGWISMLGTGNASKEDLERRKVADAIYVVNLLVSGPEPLRKGVSKSVIAS